MNTFATVVFALAVASASAGFAAHYHTPSGVVSANHDGALLSGPAGSVHTNNGLHGHGAGAQVSGPSGKISTQGGHAFVTGPVDVHHEYPIYVAPAAHHHAGYEGHQGAAAVVAQSDAHATIVGPSAHATIVGPSAHANLVGAAAHQTWGHQASAHGHHGW